MNFTGEKCVYCNAVFTEDDDVVVCPECGSPHHRECYRKENRCANSDMHSSGEKWKSQIKNIKPETEEKPLETAEQENINSLAGENFIRDYSRVLNPDEDMGGATLREMSMFVGTNTFYYIPIFKRMKDIGTKISFNLSCCIFPSFYFANRRMWLWAIISAIVSVILELPTSLVIMAEQGVFTENMLSVIYDNQTLIEQLQIMCGWGSWIFRVLICLFANRIYFKFVLKNLKRIKLYSGGKGLNPDIVTALGGVKPMNIILIMLITLSLLLVSMIGITMFISAIA
ncbi:MAG: hypothetical protein K2J08_06685 [Ruminococcus sp.]|nr:hypothetical protein [Ruminococcus sp.]